MTRVSLFTLAWREKVRESEQLSEFMCKHAEKESNPKRYHPTVKQINKRAERNRPQWHGPNGTVPNGTNVKNEPNGTVPNGLTLASERDINPNAGVLQRKAGSAFTG